jgi:polar amino acid transport system substrate-binding protein
LWGGFVVVILALSILLLLKGKFLSPKDKTWDAMQERGAWRVGMDPSFPPFEMLDDAGQPVGFDVDLARALAQEWGLDVEIVATGFDGLIDAMRAGKVDSIVSALPYDPRLTEDVYYSPMYFEAGVRLAVLSGSDVHTVDDLSGKKVAVEWGSAGDAVGRQLRRKDPSIQIVPFETPQEAVRALVDGESDALLIDGVTLRLNQAQGAAITPVGPALTSEPYVIAAPIDAQILQEHIAQTLEQLQTTGVTTELEQRWFAQSIP